MLAKQHGGWPRQGSWAVRERPRGVAAGVAGGVVAERRGGDGSEVARPPGQVRGGCGEAGVKVLEGAGSGGSQVLKAEPIALHPYGSVPLSTPHRTSLVTPARSALRVVRYAGCTGTPTLRYSRPPTLRHRSTRTLRYSSSPTGATEGRPRRTGAGPRRRVAAGRRKAATASDGWPAGAGPADHGGRRWGRAGDGGVARATAWPYGRAVQGGGRPRGRERGLDAGAPRGSQGAVTSALPRSAPAPPAAGRRCTRPVPAASPSPGRRTAPTSHPCSPG